MKTPNAPEPTPEDSEKAEPPIVTSRALLGGSRQLIIQHGDERYRLMLTRSNKLILTK